MVERPAGCGSGLRVADDGHGRIRGNTHVTINALQAGEAADMRPFEIRRFREIVAFPDTCIPVRPRLWRGDRVHASMPRDDYGYETAIRSFRQFESFHLPSVKSGISTRAPLRSSDNFEQKIMELHVAAS